MKSELETMVSLHASKSVNDETAQEINSLLRSGIDAAKNGSRDEAKALLFRVTDIEPENEMAWLWLASVSEYPEELLTFLQKVLDLNPENEQALEWERSTKALLARNLVQYGITAVQEGKKDSAKRCFLRALETDVNNEMAWLWLASISDDPQEKIFNLNKVIEINPSNDVANTLLKLLHKDEAQELLQKSKASAVQGNREEALEMLEQVKQLDADLDEVWILQAHLSESFEEKAFCFDQALACNPDNEVARVGLTSLKSILEAVNGNGAHNFEPEESMEESVEEVEPFIASPIDHAPDADELAEVSSHNGSFEAHETMMFPAAETDFAQETNKLSMSFDEDEVEEMFYDSAANFNIEENKPTVPEEMEESIETGSTAEEVDEGPDDEESEMTHFDYPSEDPQPAESYLEAGSPVEAEDPKPEPAYVSSYVEEVAAGSVPYDLMQHEETAAAHDGEEEYSASENDETMERSFDEEIKAETLSFGEAEDEDSHSFAENNGSEGSDAETEEFAGEETVAEMPPVEMESADGFDEESKGYSQMSACPFCGTENSLNDEVCGGCHGVMGLHNMDMLFSHSNADQEKLSEAIEQMEANLESDPFSAEEYFNLGLACLNVKDLDSGLKYLQKSYILNPTNSFLKGQIDELAKRMGKNENSDENSDHSAVAGKTIMVIDDSATIRKLVTAKLEKHGHNVVTAVDGMDALAKLEEVVPDLILLDITMPRLDGYQVCKLIRANDNTRFVPVVLISGKDGFFDKVRGKMCGSTTYITKPFGPEMLLRTVESYFE